MSNPSASPPPAAPALSRHRHRRRTVLRCWTCDVPLVWIPRQRRWICRAHRRRPGGQAIYIPIEELGMTSTEYRVPSTE